MKKLGQKIEDVILYWRGKVKQKIGLIDYGMGNLRSVSKAIEISGGDVEIITQPEKILKMDKIILPGVGAIKDCIRNLEKYNLVEALKEFIKTGKYFLGICLGFQALFEESTEFGHTKALGIIEGKVKKFENLGKLPVPHMGWNNIIIKKKTPLLNKIEDGDYFYFAHSYYVNPKNKNDIMTETDYGINFVSSINRGNIYGVQFHPEKSQKKGLRIINNFVSL